MDQYSHNKSANPFTLPEVQPAPKELEDNLEAPGSNSIEENSMAQAIEKGVVGGNQTPTTQPPDPVSTANPLLSDSGIPEPILQPKQVNIPTAGLSADDKDLIEKEWILKAKAIVEKTKNDPHEQNKEINVIKADYIKKRYNMDLNVDNG